jgi:hypothetical protein
VPYLEMVERMNCIGGRKAHQLVLEAPGAADAPDPPGPG